MSKSSEKDEVTNQSTEKKEIQNMQYVYEYRYECPHCKLELGNFSKNAIYSITKIDMFCPNCQKNVSANVCPTGVEYPKPKYSKDNPYPSCRLDISEKENEHS